MNRYFVSKKRALEIASKILGAPVRNLRFEKVGVDRATIKYWKEVDFDSCTIYADQNALEKHCVQELVKLLRDLRYFMEQSRSLEDEGLDEEKVYRSLLATACLDDLGPWITTKSRFRRFGSKKIERMRASPLLAIHEFVTNESYDPFLEKAIDLIVHQCHCDLDRLARAVLHAHGGLKWFGSDFMVGRLTTSSPERYPVLVETS